ncbi:MAG: hypothetical protein FWD16_04460 [Clostridia bacterium]|nr:hypothetical protein [Clostridia bacterium]
MQNIFNKKTANFDLSWFGTRYNALAVDFPPELTPALLKKDALCSKYDVDDAYEGLQSAHAFLQNIARELLQRPDEEHITYVLAKLDLIWALCLFGELRNHDNAYCLYFKKPLQSKYLTVPKNYSKAFQYIYDNGCYVDGDFLYFDDRVTALGLYLFVQKAAQKRWYWEEDKAGAYATKLFNPAVHCVEPYYRVDMRIFTCGARLHCDVLEQLDGYSDEMIEHFKTVYYYVKTSHPECLPCEIRFYNYIGCSITFCIDRKHSLLGQIGVGSSEEYFGFYGGLSGKAKEIALAEVDYSNVRRAGSCGDRFIIQNKEDVERVIHIMKIKAEYGRNIF